jgi:serine/threonine protein kinase
MLVKVLDFGIARIMRETAVTGSASRDGDLIFGTPGYMSPEQSLGDDLDARCDLWALATIAFESLTNELPVPGLTANELVNAVRKARTVPLTQYRPDLPESVAAFFERAFAKSAADRFATAAELTRAFDAACVSSARRSAPVGSTPRPRAASSIRLPRRRHPIAKAMALLALVVTGLVGVTSNWRAHHGFWITLSPSALALPQASANTSVAPVPPAPLPRASVEAKPEVAPVEAANMTAPPAPPTSIVRVVGEKHRRARRPVPVPTDVDVDVVPIATSRVPDAVSDDTPAATQSARAATSIASSGSVLGCTPPYEADATGKKHWKLECL